MKLNELKQGMVCKRRNGSKIVIANNEEYVSEDYDKKWPLVINYNADLTSKDNKKEYDIIKVMYGDRLVWERKESTFWLPEKGEKYHFVAHREVKAVYINDNDDWDREIFKTTLVFRTEEEAEKQLLKQQATIG